MAQFGFPGVRASTDSVETNLIWGGDDNKASVITMGTQYASGILDASAVPTTAIRAGLLVGESLPTTPVTEWVASASDGSEILRGVVPLGFSTLDENAVAEAQFLPMIIRAPLVAGSLLIQGAAFVGHVDEFLARRVLHGMGCILDDDPQGYQAGAGGRFITDSTAARTITAAENGATFFFTHTSANIAVTLPSVTTAPPVGLEYWIIRGANSADDFLVQSADGDDVIVGNDLTADSVTWTTTGEEIGAGIHIRSGYLGTARRWYFDLTTPPFGTGLTGGFTYAIATA